MTKSKFPDHISDRILDLCTSSETVSSLLAREPSLSPSAAWDKLYGRHALKKRSLGVDEEEKEEEGSFSGSEEEGSNGQGSTAYYKSPPTPPHSPRLAQEHLDRAAKCGKWGGKKPSELFLQIYHDALCTLDDDPLRGMVSPPLLGTCGTVPLTIISVIPDIARHMANLIYRAKHEIFLATNYWQSSVASTYLTNAIRDLNRRLASEAHLSSGVESQPQKNKIFLKVLYDRGTPKQLLSPHQIVSPDTYTDASTVGLPHPDEIPFIDMQVMNYHMPIMGTFHAKYMVVDRRVAVLQSNNIQDNDNLEMATHLEGPVVDSLWDMAMISWYKHLEPGMPCVNSPASEAWGREKEVEKTGVGQIERKVEVKRLAVTEEPPTTGTTTQPTVTPKVPRHTTEEPHYDASIAAEVARVQTSLASKRDPGRRVIETHLQAVTRLLNHTRNPNFTADPLAPDPVTDPNNKMTPYLFLPHHQASIQERNQHPEAVPMALVNRAPYGLPNHSSVSNPQNAAWLSALRNATHSVFIQTPTLNAAPLLPAILDACNRGVQVTCYVCLGYNDAGELLPHQNGHNEMIAHQLYSSLPLGTRQNLHYYWYVAKDQTKPLVQSKGLRSCHIKLMVVDGHVGIMGNGNQDTQSWFHSQEINVMIDSEEVCGTWMKGIMRNQNTAIYGALDKEKGMWVDAEGKEADGVIGVDPGGRVKRWAKGAVGAVKRVQGIGGF
ncbi:phospholipase D/nuclease [Neurospora crassa]|uniref:Phospholipase D active site-containing protein n=1 Tax=Neurospora crassa (strain ATCC 24698 / 74-OR23-1A / CBS 708.71 / DSM 1257 / FGSC 987) TaxID=367110 RepID=Q7RYC9_NEUCR|nr:phospholipase D active site-containing protein [Neurospora crassa OR74A]EAA27811.2 phospholipase D active site-containing protein [Neurospora crassa OR74A]KHE88635.1 phospholipase D/nuclease [Neurospora crassa]|eukprot:XP_957047.2 phospholipase D active site-containing protein [Neurospora crassa OR74A]